MNNFSSRLERALFGQYDFKFSHYFSEGFRLIFLNFGLVLAFALLWGLISFMSGLIPLIGPLVYYVVVGPCLLAGFYLAMDKLPHRKPLEFSDFFQGFDKVGPLVVMTLIQLGIASIFGALLFVVMAVMGIDANSYGMTDDEVFVMAGLVFVLGLPLVYLYVSWSFAPLFIVFHDMKPWQALETSRKVISEKWFMFFLLFLVGGLVAMAGVIAFVIGMAVTVPASIAINYAAFQDIIGTLEETESDQMIAHLVE